jgi:hypothetical protein
MLDNSNSLVSALKRRFEKKIHEVEQFIWGLDIITKTEARNSFKGRFYDVMKESEVEKPATAG